uniref:HTH_Tnp_Tc3_2 domain-containing protein n=1 Tax=Caenorhabditis japonica TaxID=281687 RepID=A0A8R1IFH8_CAEJA
MTKTERKVNLTTNQRFAIARGREQGRTLRQLAEQFKVDRSTFGKFLKRWRAQNGQPGKRRHSRAPVTNHQTDRNIVRASRSNPRLSAPEVLDLVSPRGSPVASVRTIRRRLNDTGMFGRRPVKKPYISDRKRAARVAWARAHLNWTQSQAAKRPKTSPRACALVKLDIKIKDRKTVVLFQIVRNNADIFLLRANSFKAVGIELRWKPKEAVMQRSSGYGDFSGVHRNTWRMERENVQTNADASAAKGSRVRMERR